MNTIHPPVVAGHFYPAEPEQIRADVDRYISEAEIQAVIRPKALIVPHAGYPYSGPVAGSAYALLPPLRDEIERVVILAPAHRVGFRGIARAGATHFRTPLGVLEVDQRSMQQLADSFPLQHRDDAFAAEHSIEVHLPFLQRTLGTFRIIPLLVGKSTEEEVSQLLEQLWGGKETLIIVSSDLSHFLDYSTACALDQRTSLAIEALKPEQITSDQACGRTPLSGLLLSAKRHRLQVATLDLRNSGDTAGPKNRVVGYGSYAFY